ncbi:MAG: thiamine pyrophosphate-binding protein, partial [Alphaproteobacteria bacterium]
MTGSKNTLSGAQAMVRMLEAYGVDHIFGLCGDTSLPFYDALNTLKPNIRHVLARDERSAAYMADAYARVTGKVGVCEGPSGGGATYIAPGLVEANESSIPVLAITTDVATTAHGHYPLTELDQRALFAPLTKFNASIDLSEKLPTLVRAAFRAMTTGKPGAAHLAFPTNVQTGAVAPDEIWAQAEHSRFPAWPTAPQRQAARAMAKALVKAKRPVLICGGGPVISGASTELARLAERLDLVVATTISGKGVLSETHPNCLGVVGSNGGVAETRSVVEEADLVMFVGCRAGAVTTEKWQVPARGTPILHLDVDPMVISATYATQVAMVADAR